MEGTKGIGSMGNTMAMASRAGLEGVGIKGSTGKGCAMDTEFTSFIQGIRIPESGAMGRAMVLACRLVLMAAATLESSSAGLNTALDATISGNRLSIFFAGFVFSAKKFGLIHEFLIWM